MASAVGASAGPRPPPKQVRVRPQTTSRRKRGVTCTRTGSSMSSLAKSPKPSSPGVEEFMGSMPASYALAFSLAEIEQHAELVVRRRGRPIHVERCGTAADETTLVCVVADDRPGLLSLICHVLVGLHLEVVNAQIYSRVTPSGSDEAVDFFWVRAQRDRESLIARDRGEAEPSAEQLAQIRAAVLDAVRSAH